MSLGKRVLNHLSQFNRKERFHLVGTAVGNQNFCLSEDFRGKLATAFMETRLSVPPDAFVAMDYHLDWLFASLHLATNPDDAGPHDLVQEITGHIQDIDLLVAYADAKTCHVILLEAKGVDGFRSGPMGSKAERLRMIFGENGEKFTDVKPHFVLTSRTEPTRLPTSGWPVWMLTANKRPMWFEMKLPPNLKRVVTNKEDGTWTVKTD